MPETIYFYLRVAYKRVYIDSDLENDVQDW